MDQDLCGNCGHWREEHYGRLGEFIGQEIGCSGYVGVDPPAARRNKKPDELVASATRLEAARAAKLEEFYAL